MIMIKCDKCEKEIEGYTSKQVEYLLAQHKLAKHNEAYKAGSEINKIPQTIENNKIGENK